MVSEVPLKGIHLTLKMTSSPVTNNGCFQNYRLTWAITLHRLYELIIVFVYEVCPTLILAAISGGRDTVHHAGVHICVHSRHLYILVVKLFLYTVEHFKTRFVLHGYFFITFKPWLCGFLQGCLASSVLDDFAAHKMYQSLRKKMSACLIVKKTR